MHLKPLPAFKHEQLRVFQELAPGALPHLSANVSFHQNELLWQSLQGGWNPNSRQVCHSPGNWQVGSGASMVWLCVGPSLGSDGKHWSLALSNSSYGLQKATEKHTKP